jgi:hypothetical protein
MNIMKITGAALSTDEFDRRFKVDKLPAFNLVFGSRSGQSHFYGIHVLNFSGSGNSKNVNQVIMPINHIKSI